jgi:hypothetical protein
VPAVIDAAAPELVVDMCRTLESFVQWLLAVAVHGGVYAVAAPPQDACAPQLASQRVLMFSMWTLGG